MAAKFGGLKTSILVIIGLIVFIFLCGILAVYGGSFMSAIVLDSTNSLHPTIPDSHDHRIDKWS